MKTAPLHGNIVKQIKDLVVNGQYSRGQKLPSERELSTLFGVGRASVREALSSLVMIGALEVRYSEGIFIKNIHSIDFMGRARSLLDSIDKNDGKTIGQAIELVKVLEIETVVRAAAKGSQADFSELSAALDGMSKSLYHADEYVQAHSRFHRFLVGSGGNDFVELVVAAILTSLADLIKAMASEFILMGHKACQTGLFEAHRNTVNALIEGDRAKAKEAVATHFEVLESFREKHCSFADLNGIDEAAVEPESLSIGVITFEDLQLTAQKFIGAMRSLEESTGKKWNWYFPTSYASLIEAHIRGFVHIAYYGPRSYLLARKLSNGAIEAFARAMWRSGPYRKKAAGYQSYLIVRSDSAYRTLEDLKGKSIALTDPVSTSGDLIPKVQLGKKLHKKISEYFGHVFYAGGHDSAAFCVLEGRADCAAVADVTMDWAVDAKRYSPADFRILWKSSLLPLNTFAWKQDLPAGLRERIAEAFFSINKTDFGKDYLSAVRSASIVAADDMDFDPIRKALNALKRWE